MSSEQAQMKKTSIGGQALIEGVMMRGPEKTAMAVRHTSGEIRTDEWTNPQSKRPAFTRWPFIRGIFNFVDSMVYGYKCLMRSAEMSGLEDELEEAELAEKEAKAAKKRKKAAKASTVEEVAVVEETASESSAEEESLTEVPAAESAVEPTADEAVAEVPAEEPAENAPAAAETAPKAKKESSPMMNVLMVVSMVLGMALALVLFIWLPIQLFNLLAKAWPSLDNRYLRSVFEGVLRIIIFLAYMLGVSRMKDIRRTFQYHGAEHKSIFCYEKGLPLTVENVRQQKRFHPRCGTSFLVLMLIVGMLISIFIPISNAILRTVVKLLLLPITVGIGYELIKLAGRKDNLMVRIISAPGLWMQRITTQEPDDGMIECAIEALKAVIPEDPEADRW